MTSEPRAPVRWRVLLTNLTLASRSGTECYTRDLALALLRRGHQPVVYSPRLGALAQELRTATVPVVADLDLVGATPDLIHGHHLVPTLTALHHFPATPGVFVCHDRLAWHDQPPRFPRLLRYVAVDDNCRDRLVLEAGVPEARVRTVLNWVDLQRFRPRAPLPERPRRALLFMSHVHADGPLAVLQAACARAGVALEVLGGGSGRPLADPERVLGDYDLVFAKGRSALEALAVGAAVMLCGPERTGPFVTTSDFEGLRRLNFGMRAIQWPPDAELVHEQLQRYDAQDAAAVSARVRSEAGLDAAVDQLVDLYAEVVEEWHTAPRGDEAEEKRASARAFAALGPVALELHNQAERIDSLSRELRRVLQGEEPMPPLDEADARLVTLAVQAVPERLAPGQTFTVEVDLTNASTRLICSAPPLPVHLAGRWWPAHGEGVVADGGPRTRLLPPLEPLGTGRYRATLRAPAEAGAYRLHLTLVQESLRWFDDLPGLRAEALVVVG